MSLRLFEMPLMDAEILHPRMCETAPDLKHELIQAGVTLTNQQEMGCKIACMRARAKTPYFAQLVVWPDGQWACFHEEYRREHPVAPGQYKKAYLASQNSEHFYHLETNTTKDLILHR